MRNEQKYCSGVDNYMNLASRLLQKMCSHQQIGANGPVSQIALAVRTTERADIALDNGDSLPKVPVRELFERSGCVCKVSHAVFSLAAVSSPHHQGRPSV